MRWPSGLEHWLGLATWLSRPGSNPFYPALPVYFGGDVLKAIGPFYLVSMARGSKISHQSSLERVTTTHSKLCPPEVRLCSRKRCSAVVSEEDRRTCPSGTWSFILQANVQPPAVVGAKFWLAEWFSPNTGLRSRSSRLGNRKAQSIATGFCPNPGLGDLDWERSRPNHRKQMAATIFASGQRWFAE